MEQQQKKTAWESVVDAIANEAITLGSRREVGQAEQNAWNNAWYYSEQDGVTVTAFRKEFKRLGWSF